MRTCSASGRLLAARSARRTSWREPASYPLTCRAPGSFCFSYPPWQMDVEASFQRGPSGTLYLVTRLGVAHRQG